MSHDHHHRMLTCWCFELTCYVSPHSTEHDATGAGGGRRSDVSGDVMSAAGGAGEPVSAGRLGQGPGRRSVPGQPVAAAKGGPSGKLWVEGIK